MSALASFVQAFSSGKIRVIDLTHTLSPEFPHISLPPEMGQAWPFRIEEVSRYDERGPAWYWNNFSCGEHTGTHFDAPVHWVSGKDLPNGAVDSIHWGAPGDVVVPGDYDGDGKDDQAVYRGGTWYMNRSTAGFGTAVFGLASDKPVPKGYIP